MTMDFCTYFDSAYLHKAMVCRHTLMTHTCVRLFVLCLDAVVEKAVAEWSDAVVIRLSDIETYKPQLLTIKGKRLPKEYYATVTPILPQYIFDRFGVNSLFYTDADIAFWSPAEEIEEVMSGYSLLVTPHENPVAIAGGAGYFNVGVLGYRNDRNCREFLEWWEARCLEWCEWRALPDGRCADQGYLSILHDQPDRFRGVLSCPQPGINLGPWNLALHNMERKDGRIVLDCRHNLVCYHYHGYKDRSGICFNDTGWEVSPWNMEHIYRPYHELIIKAQNGKL
jgi:hypothetical protein